MFYLFIYLFIYLILGGGGRRKNFMGMVSNPNVVKLINYVWWVPLTNALHLGFEKCTLTTTPSRHGMIVIQKAMYVWNLAEYYVALVGKWGTNIHFELVEAP
jgi:hypothetical protein